MGICCGLCKYATNAKRWKDKIDYGNGAYDFVYCEEITCTIKGNKYHPMDLGCNGKYYKGE